MLVGSDVLSSEHFSAQEKDEASCPACLPSDFVECLHSPRSGARAHSFLRFVPALVSQVKTRAWARGLAKAR